MGIEQPAQYYNNVYSSSPRYNGDFILSGYFPQWAFCISLMLEFYNSFKKEIGKVLTIIDLGCGPGQFAQLLNQIFNSRPKNPDIIYTGLDFSKIAIEIALKKQLSENFYFFEDDIFHRLSIFNQNDTKFTVVTALECFEHIKSDTEIFSYFKEGQFMIFSVPQFDDPAHVRHFKTEFDVLERYDRCFLNFKVEKILNIFICYGFLK
jgi:SAM-dependent methyltransferase